MSLDTLYVGNDNLIEVHNLRAVANGVFDNTAAVAMRLFEAKTQTLVVGPLALLHVANADGVYRGVLPATLPLVEGKRYLLRITAAGLSNATWDIPMVGQHRCEFE